MWSPFFFHQPESRRLFRGPPKGHPWERIPVRVHFEGVMNRRAVQVRVSLEYLERELKIPGGTRIVAVLPQDAEAALHGNVVFVLEGPDLPEVAEGQKIPEGYVVYTVTSKIEVLP